jgi:hypothetical protein
MFKIYTSELRRINFAGSEVCKYYINNVMVLRVLKLIEQLNEEG